MISKDKLKKIGESINLDTVEIYKKEEFVRIFGNIKF